MYVCYCRELHILNATKTLRVKVHKTEVFNIYINVSTKAYYIQCLMCNACLRFTLF